MKAEMVFLIDGSNFIDYPKGGQLSFCSQLLDVFPEGYFKLVGITTHKDHKIGVWQTITIGDCDFEFFPVYFLPPDQIKGFWPERLKLFVNLLKFRKRIFGLEKQPRILSNTPEALIAITLFGKKTKILHFLHGVENPLKMPRFKWGKAIKAPFWNLFLRALSKADYRAATADAANLKEFIEVNKISGHITSFPTRFDDNVFKNLNYQKPGKPLFIYCGRINMVKGWELLIDSFFEYTQQFGNAALVFLGDGEDRPKLQQKINEYGLEQHVTITGFLNKTEIVEWLNKASVFVLPSYKEGWPIALIEALACGLPIVATNVSGANDMIFEGVNGYIVKSRTPVEFAQAMFQAQKLESPNPKSLNVALNYGVSGLHAALITAFPGFFNPQ